jgi:hypothetical protein
VPRKKPEPTETAGTRLKRETLARYDLNPAELLLLDRAASIADVLERIDAAVAVAALTTEGSTGQRVAEPLLREQREHGARLASLLESIALPAPHENVGRSSTSLSAQRAAHVRWAKQKGRGA